MTRTVTAQISLDEVVRILDGVYRIPAYVEQTGGGCATIYAGESFEQTETNDCYMNGVKYGTVTSTVTRYPALAGPGWFDGPGWTNAQGDLADFAIGPDDDGESDATYTDATWSAHKVAAKITEVIRGHACQEHPVPYESDGPLGHGWECGICGQFLQAG